MVKGNAGDHKGNKSRIPPRLIRPRPYGISTSISLGWCLLGDAQHKASPLHTAPPPPVRIWHLLPKNLPVWNHPRPYEFDELLQ